MGHMNPAGAPSVDPVEFAAAIETMDFSSKGANKELWEGMWAKKCKRLEAERDTYRDALLEIKRITPAHKHAEWPHHHKYLYIARTALDKGPRAEVLK